VLEILLIVLFTMLIINYLFWWIINYNVRRKNKTKKGSKNLTNNFQKTYTYLLYTSHCYYTHMLVIITCFSLYVESTEIRSIYTLRQERGRGGRRGLFLQENWVRRDRDIIWGEGGIRQGTDRYHFAYLRYLYAF